MIIPIIIFIIRTTVEVAIVIGIVVIVVNDIVILFIDIAILGTYYSGIAGKMGKLNFGFGFFFLHSVKNHTQAC